MATFPTLKTGAVIQYPATKSVHYSSFVVRFLDGTDQRYRQYGTPLHRWAIDLELLDEGELNTLEQFFIAQEGSFASFIFVDPWTQTSFPNCSIDQDILDYQLSGESQGAMKLIVSENRV
jgi:Conserved hypothetical protein 2217 (DUF2460)